MTRHLTVARTCRALTLLDLTAAAWLLAADEWLLTVLVVWAAPGLIVADALCRRAHRRARAEAQHTARLEAGEQVEPLVPCCSFWEHSDGQAHGPGCTRRPLLPRRDTYRLEPAERTAFAEIASHYDHGTAA